MTHSSTIQAGTANRYRLSTQEFADQLAVKPQSVRKLYAAVGSYHGIAPLRLPNRRLLWPDDTIARLAAETFGTKEGA